jgi:serine/threonine protein kinase
MIDTIPASAPVNIPLRNSSSNGSGSNSSGSGSNKSSSFQSKSIPHDIASNGVSPESLAKLTREKSHSSEQAIAIPSPADNKLSANLITTPKNPLKRDVTGLMLLKDMSKIHEEEISFYKLDPANRIYCVNNSDSKTEVYKVTQKKILVSPNIPATTIELEQPRIIKIFWHADNLTDEEYSDEDSFTQDSNDTPINEMDFDSAFSSESSSEEELLKEPSIHSDTSSDTDNGIPTVLERSLIFLKLLHSEDKELQCIYYKNKQCESFSIINQPWYPGIPLDNYLKAKDNKANKWTIDEKLEIINIFTWVMQAIIAINKLNIIHGDIKPGNIIIDKDNQKAYLVDLEGSAIIHDDFPQLNEVIVATEHYIAPEFCQTYKKQNKFNAKEAHDIFCAGMTLLALLGFGYDKKGIAERDLNGNCYGRAANCYTVDIKATPIEDIKKLKSWVERNKAEADNKLITCLNKLGDDEKKFTAILNGILDNNPAQRWDETRIMAELTSLKDEIKARKSLLIHKEMKKIIKETISNSINLAFFNAQPSAEIPLEIDPIKQNSAVVI